MLNVVAASSPSKTAYGLFVKRSRMLNVVAAPAPDLKCVLKSKQIQNAERSHVSILLLSLSHINLKIFQNDADFIKI